MQSRRDQVQAHLFVMSRLASGMLRAEPDAPDTPHGRTTRGAVIGIALGMAACAGVGVFGLISPGVSTSLPKAGTLVMVKETGARYLYLGGALHSVLNETSAKLLAGDQMTMQQVGQASLAGVTRAAPVGIVGAPDGLPPAAQLDGGAWLACGVSKPGQSGGATPQLALAVGAQDEGDQLSATQGALVATPDGGSYLLWDGQRLKVDTANGALQALGYAQATPTPVTASFLNALPAGSELTAPVIDGRGTAGPSLAGAPSKVGQLFAGPSGEHYVLTGSGLVPLTNTLLALLRGDPRTQHDAYGGGAVTVATIGPEDLAAHTAAGVKPSTALPADPPQLVTPGQGQGVCADTHPGAGSPVTSVSIVDAAAVAGLVPPPQPGVVPTCTQADLIAVRPGGGALVRALSGGGNGTTDYLVTDAGVKYPIPSAAVVKSLGYAAVSPTAVPDGLLTFLPTGPSLDPSLLANGGVVNPSATNAPCAG
ncbi:type VII secretion protein EccB [Kitasatospora sp. GAS204A]|uniref:type VII secretion protein EccB n=1 Tax=unclassified Kitasatospora TaxID=2633591 RepID=UPI002474CFE9|nr:type VII secretion protein EccB [Kitasatospora sp. GAS204B]MDH6116818.1 type VII secretion protein EccB [Kitasatospora sp. GAS204B]